MKKLLLVILLVSACGRVDKEGPIKVVAAPEVLSSCSVELFCREDTDQQAKVDALIKAGKQFSGVLNANGVNCNHTLWCK